MRINSSKQTIASIHFDGLNQRELDTLFKVIEDGYDKCPYNSPERQFLIELSNYFTDNGL